jgi:hypothetical protein
VGRRLPVQNLRPVFIRVSDPSAVPELLTLLERRPSYVVKRAGTNDIAISVLGSFADAGALDVRLYLRVWQMAHPEISVEILREER